MIYVWNKKVYSKIRVRLTEAFVKILERRREEELENEERKLRSQCREEEGSLERDLYKRDHELELIETFIQFIADLSINEISVHHLGSTKMTLIKPYLELHRVMISETEYYV